MSMDNGVYIIKNKKGYRVTEACAIYNLWWWNTKAKNPADWENRSEINPKEVENYFGDSKYYKTIEAALKKAFELYQETEKTYGMCEYGIQDLGEY